MKEEFRRLMSEYQEHKYEMRRLQNDMANIVIQFDGSLKDALAEGLVRLNFPAPPGFNKWIHSEDH